MTRPQIIRADSIDLQDHDTPSAKEHKHPASSQLANGQSLGPHQAETLREVAAETKEDRRVSWTNGDIGDIHQYIDDGMQQQDALAIAQNGGGTDDGQLDTDGEDDLDDDDDDDMMDKISSSPSIEDGEDAPSLPPPWPARIDSLRNQSPPKSSPVSSEPRSSSPYLQRPDYLPIPFHLPNEQSSKASAQTMKSSHHLSGEYAGLDYDKSDNDETDDSEGSDAHNAADGKSHTCIKNNGKQSDENFKHDEIVDPNEADIYEATENDLADPDEPMSPYDFLIPYDASDDDYDDFSLTDEPDFVDSGWGAECLQDLEDIDFEFVYALHTFVATVEGQANATKGDTMVLLDDSNSYWWLVRVVKDSSIGYLPAEHIETPTERLARLNKHRNIDLAQTMLGDTPDKGKSSLKTAMRRRKKTVTFTAPTYVEASDVDYSSDEEDELEAEATAQDQATQQAQAQQAASDETAEDESAKVEPLKPRSQKQAGVEAALDETIAEDDAEGRASEEIFDNRNEARVRTTKNGTVRNTDSFFKDETIETKKISLTPALFRDDETRDSNSLDSQGLRSRPSFDRLEKELVSDKQKKKEKEKKDKDKKPSGIRGLFSRSKDKKKKSDDGDDESLGKRSLEAGTEAGDEESKSADAESSPDKSPGPQRSSSKLQKQQRGDPSPTRKNSNARDTQATAHEAAQAMAKAKEASASLRMVESEPIDAIEVLPLSQEKSKISKILHPPPKVSKAKSRVELDDFDSSDDGEIVSAPEPSRAAPAPAPEASQRPAPAQQPSRPTLPGAYPDSYISTQVPTPLQEQPPSAQPTQRLQNASGRLSESPVQVSPITSSHPPALVGDTSSQEDRSSPVSSPSPELMDGSNRGHHNQDSMTSTSAAGSTTWNDNNLRAFFDSSTEIRDLLTVVYDKSDVPPAGPDHPVVGTLFKEQNAKLAEITSQLDNMLGDWLARKQRLRGTV
ncbi:hypothetical protein PFICI_12456 [Pestalotiopsis fici W106-1]|uniref:SH3 domain-containing protein n=1 Tax=Pestalotiopsis fici (strain W106-1 / CGMCC3.15140) TaxID=1229662 RepID=W3WQT0_PESFW|nr:uncharacterized protein PFICI_12456 [Pestalotiopsis fici W106-1]ETS75512.1 hypothetical protein PFICI_12456 [Pestalotiopsis fici W106-1]